MSKHEKTSGRGVLGLLARAERFAWGVPALGRVGGWTAALTSTVVAGVCAPALGGPEGARVVRGQVGIERIGSETIIRASDRAIINYRSFDIRSHETVRFIQPGADARVMNRIESRHPTRIDGSLIANGRVYLVNPSGVIFGSTASVDVKGLVAAAGTITDTDFVRGIDRFTNLRGEVSNYGTLTADFVGLLGAQVSNSGRIVAPEGTVVMGAGREVLVGERTGNVFVQVKGEARSSDGRAAVENTGTIDARRGRVRAAAGDVYGLALRVAGDIKATDVRVEGQGRGEVHATGRIDASNDAGRGGEVRVLGEKVGLSGATIDASGSHGGGTVLVGGNFQGRGPERNAEQTFVSRNSTIKADGGLTGDGGTVIVWADRTTIFNGTITATGGELRGDGGFVEVSGKIGLGFHGDVDTSAPNGRMGMLLLDPLNIVVQDTGADDSELNDNTINFNDRPGETLTISDEIIEGRTSNITLQATNNVTFDFAIVMGGNPQNGVGITVNAGNNIIINQPITLRGGNLTLSANDATTPGGPSGTGSIQINANIDTAGGNQSGGAVSMTVGAGTGTIALGGNINTRSGAVTFTGPVTVSGARTVNTGDGATTNTAPISFTSTVTGGAGSTLTLTAGNSTGRSAVSLGGAVTGLEGLTITNATTLATNGITTSGTGNISVNHNGVHTVNAAINAAGTYTQASATGASTTLNAGISTTNANITFNQAITLGANAELNAGSGTVAINDAALGGFALTLTGDEIDLNGNNNGITSGTLITRPSTGGLETRVSGTAAGGRLDITTTEVAKVASSVTQWTIGSAANNGALNVNSNVTFLGSTTLVTGGQLTVDANITASAGTLRLHGGADGGADAGGSVRFTGAGRTLAAGSIQLDAGNQAGTSDLDLITNTPIFRGAAGGATSPTTFSIRQDAAFADAAIPAAAQFGNGVSGMTYAIESSGALTLSTASKVAGSSLTLTGTTTTLSSFITVASATLVGTSAINLDESIATTGGVISLTGNVVLGANVGLDTTNSGANAAGANVTHTSGTIEGTTDVTEDLFINAGTGGAISLGGAIGGTTRLATFQVTNGATLSTQAVRAETITTSTITSATFGGLLNATSGGISLTSATLNVNAGATTTSGGTFTANAGTLLSLATGTLTLDGAFLKSGAGATNLGTSITTTGDVINFSAGNVTLTANSALDSTNAGGNAAGANVTIAGTVNGAFNLFVAGGTGGAVQFSSAVGGGTALNTFQVTSSGTLNTAAVNAATLTGSATTTATFGGLLTGGAGGITLTSATVNVQNGATTTGSMSVTAGTAFNATGAAISAATGFTKSGAGLSSLSVNVSTTNTALNFSAGSVIFNADANLSAGTGTLTLQATDLNGRNVGMFANAFTFGGSISGSLASTLRLGGAATTTTIGVAGGAGDCQITGTNLGQLANDAVGTLFIGRSGQSGNIAISGGTFLDAVQVVTTGTITTAGTITGDQADASITLQGSTLSMAGTIRTTGATIALTGPVVLTSATTLNTTHNAAAAGGNVSASSTINGTPGGGTEDLAINGGTSGVVTLSGAVGGSEALGAFLISNAGSVATGAVSAASISSTAQGLVNHGGALTAGAGGITLAGASVTLGAGGSTTGGGTFTVTASGGGADAFTLTGNLGLDGAFTSNGAAINLIGGNITTTNDAITFLLGDTRFTSDATLNAGTSTLSFQNVEINGRNVTWLANAFDFLAGPDSVTGTGAGSIRFGGAADATTIGVAGGAGTSQVETADLQALADEAAGTIFIGRTGQTGNIVIAGGTFRDAVQIGTTGTVTQTGTLTGDQADASVTLQGSLVNLGGTIRTTGATVTITGPAVLTANATIDTTHNATPAGAAIAFSSTINATAGGPEEDLSLNAGTGGTITHTGVIGGTTALGIYQVVNASGITLGNLTTNTAIDVTVVGTGTFGTLTSDGISLTGATLNMNGLLTAGAGAITIAGGAANVNAGATTTGSGSFTALNTGTLTLANTALTLDGTFVRSGGATTLGVNITTTNDNIAFTGGAASVTLSGAARTLTAGTGAISFGSTLAAGSTALTLNANGITFGGGANSVTGAGSATLTLLPATGATSIGVAGGAGTLQITQATLTAITDGAFSLVDIGAAGNTHTITVGAASLRDPTRFLAGGVGGQVTTSGAVSGTTSDSNLTFAGATNTLSNITTLGSLTITGGVNSLSGSLVTQGGVISITGPVVITANSLWDTTNAGAAAGGGNITTSASVDGPFNLTMRAGTGGGITIGGLTGGVTRLADLTVVSVSPTTAVFTGDVLADSYTQNSGSATFGGILNVTGAVSIAGTTFQFAGEIEADSFTQASGTSTFNGTVGITGDITLTGTSFTFNQAVSGGTITQTSGSSVFNGLVTTSGLTGLSLTGTTISLNAGVNTLNGVNVTIVNSGLLTIANAPLTLTGSFSKSGAGLTNLGANITTTNAAISFAGGGTTLTQNVVLNTGAGAGTITFGSTLDGARTLGLAAGTGSVAFNSAVGGATPLTSITVTSAAGVTSLSTIDVAQNVSLTATGAASFAGLVTAPAGFSGSVGSFTQLGGITTTNTAIAVTSAGAVTSTGALQAGTGAISLSGTSVTQGGTVAGGSYTVTSTGDISIAEDITAATIDIHAGTDGTGDLTFTVAGIEVLGTSITLNAGDGTGGGGTAAIVDYTTNGVIFRGLSGGGTSPTSFTHEQDASITNALIALASQFGNGPAGMNYTLCSNDGSVFITDATKFAGANLTLCGTGAGDCVEISTDLNVGDLTINSAWCVTASVTISGNTLFFNGSGETFGNAVVFRGTELDYAGAIVGTGTLAFEPGSASQNIVLGGAGGTGALDLTLAELAFITDGFGTIRIGRSDGTGTISTAAALTLTDPFTFQSPGGAIEINHLLRGTDNASFMFEGPTRLAASVRTAGNTIFFNDEVTIAAASVLIDSTDLGADPGGAGITFNDSIDADAAANDRALEINAGTTLVTIDGNVGGSQALGSLTVTANTFAPSIFVESVTTRGAQTYTGWLSTEGDLTSTVGGAITITGNLRLENDLTITTAGLGAGDGVLITGEVTGDGNGLWDFGVNAGIATVEFGGNVGDSNAPASVAVTGGSILVNDVTAVGGISLNGPTFLSGNLTGQGVNVAGALRLETDSIIAGSTFVTLGSTVESANGLARSLTINSPTTTIVGSVGATSGHELGFLETDSAGTTTLGGASINVVSGMDFRDNVLLSGGGSVVFSALSNNFGDPDHGVTFRGTLNSVDSTARAVTINTGAGTRFFGAVGNTNALGSLTTNTGGFTRLGGNVTTTGAQSYGDDVLLDGTVLMNASNVTFSRFVDSADAGTPRALSINAPGGAVSFAFAAGENAPLLSLTANASTISLKSVRTRNAQAYTGAATVDGELFVVDGGGISFSGPTTILANSQLSSNAGGITITGAASATDATIFSRDGAITITGATTLANTVLRTETGAITIDGTLQLAGNAILLTEGLATDDIVVTGAIDSTGASHALTINARNDTNLIGGDITLGGDVGLGVGGLLPLQTLTLAGNTISVRGVRTVGTQTYTGTTTLNGALATTGPAAPIILDGDVFLAQNVEVTTTDGNVTFGGAVDHAGTPRSLTIVASGANTVRFNGAVGGATDPTRLSSFSVTTGQGGRAILNGAGFRASGDTAFSTAVELHQDVVVGGGTVAFNRTVDSDGTPRTLTVNSPGLTTFAGAVGQTGILKRLTSDAGGQTRFEANASTTHGMIFNDVVQIAGVVTLDGGGMNTSDDADDPALPGRFRRMFFGEGIATNGTDGVSELTIRSGFDPNGIIAPVGIEGDIGAANARFRNVTFGRTTQSGASNMGRAATIVFAPAFDAQGRVLAAGVTATRNFTIFATQNFTMNAGEKITAFGALRIMRADLAGADGRMTGIASLGDLTALGDITVRANSIRITQRSSTQIFEKQRDGSGGIQQFAPPILSPDERVSIVSGGATPFTGFISLFPADTSRVVFSTNAAAQGDLQGGFQIQDFQSGSDGVLAGVTAALFVDEGNASILRPFDLRARGAVTETIATSIAGAIPRESATREVVTPAAVSDALREALQEMGIRVRDLSFSEMIEFLVGWSTYRDLPTKPRPGITDYSVTANRLSLATVEAAVEAYRDLLYTTSTGPDGETITEKRTAQIQGALAGAWEAYAETVDEPTGTGFRDYLETRGGAATPDEALALEVLNGAREVFARLDALGLSAFEASFPKESLVGELLPPEMTPEQLKEAIAGSVLAMF